jgi:cytochrome c oxidase assembly protein subunit 11
MESRNEALANKNRRLALIAGSGAATMLGLAYASAPLYSLFCQVTGFGGTTQKAEKAPDTVSDVAVTVRFDANTDSGLPWRFHAKDQVQTIKVGEVGMAAYIAENLSGAETTGTAVFNVTPPEAGIFFNKIACFCFTEQKLKPGETVEMPVQYFIDPAMLADANSKGIREIVLSYSFYPAKTGKPDKQATLQAN